MALYTPDYKLQTANKLVKKMQEEGYVPTTKEEADQILYHIKCNKEWADKQQKKLDEYHSFFVQLDRFLPKHNVILG